MRSDLARATRAIPMWAWIALTLAMVFLSLIPVLGSSYNTAFALNIAMYVALAASWNLMAGYTGYVSFGHVAFWGVGAYACAIVVATLEMHWTVGLLAGILAAVLLAVLVGGPILRLSGVYFAIATLAAAEALKVLTSYARGITRGGGGIYLLPDVSTTTTYFLMIVIAISSVAFVYFASYTRFGRSLLAIRENEVAARSLGVATVREKTLAYVASGVFAGAAGAVYVLNTTFIDPGTAFDITITLRSIMMSMFGGIGTVLGPVVGAIGFEVPSEWLWARFPFVHKALLGGLIIVIVLLLPQGVIPAVRKLRDRWRRRNI